MLQIEHKKDTHSQRGRTVPWGPLRGLYVDSSREYTHVNVLFMLSQYITT